VALAQESLPYPPRTEYTFHVYVDPIFGDDVLAATRNPRPGGTILPLDRHPDQNLIPASDLADGFCNHYIGGVLSQAPVAFRTINAAALYADPPSTPGSQSLLGFTNGPNTIRWVVIHCLPGLYGPRAAP
jgi:hypothetical protein